MNYKGYIITHDRDHYVVAGSEGKWTEDTVTDAKDTIDSIDKENDYED